MIGLFVAFWAEHLKIRRSKIFLLTFLACLFMTMIMGLLMFVAKNPELAQKFGILGIKASILEVEANWSTYFGFLNMGIAMGGLIGFGFVTSWVFGREYSDRTMKDLLALPIPRLSIVSAKFVAIVIWCILLSVFSIISGLIIGIIVGLAGWSNEFILHSVYIFMMTSVLTIVLCTPVAFIANFGRGYLAPIGFVIVTAIIAQFMGVLGLSPYTPWAIPALYCNAGGAEAVQLGIISYIILFLTGIIGLISTFVWWRYADQA
ncbi:MAG: ABC transporter permease [Candidatus Hermodarchaeota archaeon]